MRPGDLRETVSRAKQQKAGVNLKFWQRHGNSGICTNKICTWAEPGGDYGEAGMTSKAPA